MGIRITGNKVLENTVADSQKQASESLEKLSSGIVFTRSDPRPADRAISDSMSLKLRDLNAQKRNANDGISMIQTADGALNEISNISVRMKELATQASSPALSDMERKFLFVEYQGLYDEINRIAKTTSFNGMPLLNSEDPKSPKEISFQVGTSGQNDREDLSRIKMTGLEKVLATPDNLGLQSAERLLRDDDGVSIDDVMDLFDDDSDSVGGAFQEALTKIASMRTVFGSVGSRLARVLDVIDVTQENLAAAQSRLRDVDYATETANLARANILVQAGASMLAQGNLPAQAALTLVKLISD